LKEKLLIFSGHDFTLMNVISNLFSSVTLKEKIYSSLNKKEDYLFLLPPLASSFIIELIEVKDNPKKYLRAIYNGEEIKENFAMNIEYDRKLGLLDFEQFKSLLLSRINFAKKFFKLFQITNSNFF
jgi:hypothetical protein